MTRFWKTVLLITLIVPIMLLVGAFGWYATAQAPRAIEDARQQTLRERDSVVKQQEFLDLAQKTPAGNKLVRDDVRSNVVDSRLQELREKAALAEKRSIERASVLRERLKQSEGVGDAEVKKALRAELRVVVLDAFKARHDLHAAEVASFEKQAQAMKRKLVEREASSADIVDRRVEDLLNPDNQWNAESPASSTLKNSPPQSANVSEADVKLYYIQDLPLWTKDGTTQHFELLILYLETRVDSAKNGGDKIGSYDAERGVLVVRGDARKHQQIAQLLTDLRASSGPPAEDLAMAKLVATYSIADLPLWSKDGKKQSVDLLLSYLRYNVDPPSWESKATRAVYNDGTLSLIVQGTEEVHNGIKAALSRLRVEPSSRDENKLLVRRSENSVKVEGHFDGNEEILLVIGDPTSTAAVKELKSSTPVHKAGEYVIEVRQDVVKIDGGGTVPGLVFQVHNVPNTVQSTSNISFTDKDPLPNGKVVIASPKTKLLLKRKTDQVIVTVGHVELPKSLNVVPINIVIRRKDGTNREVKTYQNVVPTNGREPSLDGVLPGTDRDSHLVPQPTGKQLGTVLGKPIHEGDLNKNTSTGDNLKRLLLQPLTDDYCRKHKLDRAEELQTKIKDERNRRIARFFVLPAELHRHLFEKHGGRVILSAFGPVPVDGLKKWLEEREHAGDFELTDPDLKATYRELWMQAPADAQFASPDQIKAAFDPALTDRFIETFVKREGMVDRGPEPLAVDEITRLIDSIKNRTNTENAVKRLRTFTALDFGDGVDRESRQAWLEWWDREKHNIENAAAGVREFTVADRITDPVGNPIAGATVRVHVPFKSSPTGQYQLAHTISDRNGNYVLQFGIPPFATKEELTWQATFTARNPPRFVADVDYSKFERTLHRKLPERDGNAPKYEEDTIFVGLPAAMKFMLRPAVKPRGSAETDASPKAEQPARVKPADKLPDDKPNDAQSEARSEYGQTKIAIGQILYSLPFSFPSVDAILSQMTEGKAHPKHERIECELVKYQVSEARHYPLVGPAQLVQAHFKSTVTSEAGREVVYSDSSHLIRVPPE